MYDVFLSYAREDDFLAKQVAAGLTRLGLSVWWDRQLVAGQNFHHTIQKAIDESICVVVLWSNYSVESEWVLNEASHGADKDALIPILLSEARIPLAFRSRQTVDWRRDPDQALESVVEGVRHASIGARRANFKDPQDSNFTSTFAPRAAEERDFMPHPGQEAEVMEEVRELPAWMAFVGIIATTVIALIFSYVCLNYFPNRGMLFFMGWVCSIVVVGMLITRSILISVVRNRRASK